MFVHLVLIIRASTSKNRALPLNQDLSVDELLKMSVFAQCVANSKYFISQNMFEVK